MKNVKMTRKGSMLVIEVDLSQDFGPSKSGKTRIICSSEGNVTVPGDEGAVIGLNVYKRA